MKRNKRKIKTAERDAYKRRGRKGETVDRKRLLVKEKYALNFLRKATAHCGPAMKKTRAVSSLCHETFHLCLNFARFSSCNRDNFPSSLGYVHSFHNGGHVEKTIGNVKAYNILMRYINIYTHIHTQKNRLCSLFVYSYVSNG